MDNAIKHVVYKQTLTGWTLSGGNCNFAPSESLPAFKHVKTWFNSLNKKVPKVKVLSVGQYDNMSSITIAEAQKLKLKPPCDGQKNEECFAVVASVLEFGVKDRTPWYESVPDLKCDAKYCKVESMGDGRWRCEKNGKVYPNYLPRYILNLRIMDYSGNIWVTAFNKQAQAILDISAVDAEKCFQNDIDEYHQIFDSARLKRFEFVITARQEMYEDDMRVKYSVKRVMSIDAVVESQALIEKIAKLQLEKTEEQYENEQKNEE